MASRIESCLCNLEKDLPSTRLRIYLDDTTSSSVKAPRLVIATSRNYLRFVQLEYVSNA
jgi:hypothetical protein